MEAVSVSIKFNGKTEITLTPAKAKDKELLGLAIRGNSVNSITIAETGAVTFLLEPAVIDLPGITVSASGITI